MPADPIEAFIAKCEKSSAAERANLPGFVYELCDLLGVPRPDQTQADDDFNSYVFERSVDFIAPDGKKKKGRIDLYKRGCFVLEGKQGADKSDGAGTDQLLLSGIGASAGKKTGLKKGTATRGTAAWDDAMLRARLQAESYAKALPVSEGWPPFLIVTDVAHSIELFADFSRTGKHYAHFPDARSFRIRMSDLRKKEVRDQLREVWLNPESLNPATKAAKVTRIAAVRLADLARSLEDAGHSSKQVADFLTRCLFCFFAEDTGLLPEKSFTKLLEELVPGNGHEGFVPVVSGFWREMDKGGFSSVIRKKVMRFNGSFFESPAVLPVSAAQLKALIHTGHLDWSGVEPAIIGTLLERALDREERHNLGAHYTPRAYVERLVLPTLIEPLREDFRRAYAEAVKAANSADKKKSDAVRLRDARKILHDFHDKLVAVRVLDPACGSGNFLYVALEHLKRLEGEIFEALSSFGDTVSRLEVVTVSPKQFLGIELNPRAAALAELVLWIGHFQWHFRTRTDAVPEPVLENHKNIENRDAVLAYDSCEIARDKTGKVVERWDGKSRKIHPVTGELVPDESHKVPDYTYANPRPATWPKADFIVGNPPFIGDKLMRQSLGDGYVKALRTAYPDVGDSSDFVLYWWNNAAWLARGGRCRRFGFITTNSLRQIFNRRVIEAHLRGDPATPASGDSGTWMVEEEMAATGGSFFDASVAPDADIPPTPLAKAGKSKQKSPPISTPPPLFLRFAIADHPWVDAADGAAVRIAMTVADRENGPGKLLTIIREAPPAEDEDGATVEFSEAIGRIHADLTTGANVAGAKALKGNDGMCANGFCIGCAGFLISEDEAKSLGLGRVTGIEERLRLYRNGRDLTERPRGVRVIDLYGLTDSDTRRQFPEIYQWVFDRVKPERDHNKRESRKRNWWLFNEVNPTLRRLLTGLPRYIATVETAKHRVFQFLDASIRPDHMLIAIADGDAYTLGVLTSRMHIVWALASGGTLEDRPRYNKSRCFETFPFPEAKEAQKKPIRALAEELDSFRKTRLEGDKELTLTRLYNALEAARSGRPLTAKEKRDYDAGQVAILRSLHDQIDAAVAGLYGLTPDDSEDVILARLVALNAERHREENGGKGRVRYLRPELQKR